LLASSADRSSEVERSGSLNETRTLVDVSAQAWVIAGGVVSGRPWPPPGMHPDSAAVTALTSSLTVTDPLPF
jgi:hypothetical protein